MYTPTKARSRLKRIPTSTTNGVTIRAPKVVRYLETGTCWLEGESGHGCIDGFIFQTFIYYGCLESIYIMIRQRFR
uniref:Uncharacterized protein n=1 Tax=Helianthus annuus TaxID=4232 RepID=A0A251VHH0_HELAN